MKELLTKWIKEANELNEKGFKLIEKYGSIAEAEKHEDFKKISYELMEVNKKIKDAKIYEAYEEVRRSGVTNMFDIRTVSQLSGLNREEIIYVMENYTELRNKYEEGE